MQQVPLTNYEAKPEFLLGGGEMGKRIREFDWSNTLLGHPHEWPQSLKTCIRIMLTSQQPIWIGWGKELIKFYNDPYKDIVRGKHPWALGAPACIVWKEIWPDIEPMLRRVMEKNEGTYVESQLLIMERNGYPEETYYTFSYTPIPGDQGGTAGMFCANTDDTEKITSERQLKTLTQLGKVLIDSGSYTEVVHDTIDSLKDNPFDFPVAFFRRIENNIAKLEDSSFHEKDGGLTALEIGLNSGDEIAVAINKAINTRRLQVVEGIAQKYKELPTGAWSIPPDKLIVIPIMQPALKDPYGILFVGMNPFRLFDEKYKSFFSLVADQIATSFTQVNVLEEERKRAAALAEIDKAKTIFFTNISHEFRTPLTLMLGSMEELLNKQGWNNEFDRKTIETTHRNALRLLRLVNNLLDFSRLEAGRTKAQFQRSAITQFTSDVASNFRGVAEAAGLEFRISADAIIQPVYIDKEMWEKIVLNLLSNAFKYTLNGSISISLRAENDWVILKVKDTGVGIPDSELPKMFQRFHRVENITGRSFEGTGIGLSLVKELVHLHGGEISVTSKVGEGSEFIVSIPTGKLHLAKEHVIEKESDFAAVLSEAFIEEAHSLIEFPDHEDDIRSESKQPVVLVVDDNIDMRSHIKGILQKQFRVIGASNGMDALQKLKEFTPDLIVSDIMMPIMDGIHLLKAVKENPQTATLPVILVSARAGEESRIEGYEIGADDYLVKPFSSKELLARVGAQISLAKKRRMVENHLHNLFVQAPTAIQILRGPEFIYELANERSLELLGKSKEEVVGRKLLDVMPEASDQGIVSLLQRVFSSGERYVADEVPIYFLRDGIKEDRFVRVVYQPLFNEEDEVTGIMITGDDITAQVMARKKIEESEAQFRSLAENLERIVGERTRELEQKNQELSRSNDDLQQFAHVASHDLKEPVRKVRTFANRLNHEYGLVLPDNAKSYLNKMEKAAERMYTMIDGVLKYSSLTTMEEEIETIDLNLIVQAIQSDLEVIIEEKKATIDSEVLPIVEGSSILLYQLFYNLIYNSLKFAKPGIPPVIKIVGELLAEREAGEQTTDTSYQVSITIRDNGIGFNNADARRIFKPFSRLNPKDKFEGTGLGLALCKKIVERYGGNISASGVEDEGSIFYISLPAKGNVLNLP